jgi:acetylglutamate kinase
MKDVGQRSLQIAVLKHAIPYLALFRGRIFVIKLGGGALEEPRAVAQIVEQSATLHHLGIRVVLVHGGGAQASALARDLGLEVQQVDGRRITDEPTLRLVTMALNGEVNTRLISACRAAGLPAVGVSGVDGGLVCARRRPPVAVEGQSAPVDFGHVGDIESVDPRLLLHLLDGGWVPVVSPLSADRHGALLNINADSIAAALAVALRAEKLIVLVEPPGLLEDVNDPASLVSYVDLRGLARMRYEGKLGGGMLPKAAAIEAALTGGVPRAHLVSWHSRDAILEEVFTNEGCGTLFVPELAVLRPEEARKA